MLSLRLWPFKWLLCWLRTLWPTFFFSHRSLESIVPVTTDALFFFFFFFCFIVIVKYQREPFFLRLFFSVLDLWSYTSASASPSYHLHIDEAISILLLRGYINNRVVEQNATLYRRTNAFPVGSQRNTVSVTRWLLHQRGISIKLLESWTPF